MTDEKYRIVGTPHDHQTFVPECFRCQLSRDEACEELGQILTDAWQEDGT